MSIKFIEQPDQKDCGPTCLAMISRYYGKKVSITKIREFANTDLYGTNILGMAQAGKEIGFNIEGYRINTFSELKKVSTPFIAHIINEKGLEHFVIIEKIYKGMIHVVDPGVGKYIDSEAKFINKFTNIILTVKRNPEFSKQSLSPSSMSFFLKLLKPNFYFILFILICSVIISAISILGAFYFKFLIDKIIPTNILENLHNLSIGILFLYLCFLFTSYIRYQLILKMGLKINKKLMLDYYDYILKLPINFFETRKDGEILSRFRDTESIREAFSSVTVTLIVDIMMILVGTVLLFNQSSTLFIVVLLIIPIYILLIYIFKKPFEKLNRQEMEVNSELSSKFLEGIRGIDVLKSYTSENYYYKKIKKDFDYLLEKVYRLGIYANVQLSIKDFMKLFTVLLVLWIGASKVMSDELSLGELLTFNALVVYFLSAVERLIQSQIIVQSAIVATKRVNEILDLSKETVGTSENSLNEIKSIKINSLDFNYGFKNDTLKNINIDISSGENVALVGESGSGKSTIAKLLLKFYLPSSGEILVNDKRINDLSTFNLRKIIGYVPQNSYIFFGTIKDNLLLNNLKYVTEEEMIEACKLAEIHDFITELPRGYNTVLENNGDNLSGGQKQRIEIARALIKKPRLLILDEATSSLDSSTSKLIMNNINSINCTKVIITHEINLIKNSDKIITLSDGQVLEKGCHIDLLNNNSLYKNLWELQNK
ncbi:peptidase domain-containing ABC transporter [Staphylococcus equorum]|uniref:peptidase domain-containing ABC transporter n=1 Tax=Staphylococcus equorum TaxID=246432 RepID=UPI001300499B|nr:peptidase domain-containing ABC transporter [Staphylococcus equorum]